MAHPVETNACQVAAREIMDEIFQNCLPGLRYQLWDGTEGSVGSPDGSFRIVIRDRETFRQALSTGDSGQLATAFVESRIDIEGDLLACLRIVNQLEDYSPRWRDKFHLWRTLRRL